MLTKAAALPLLGLIWIYQQFISPRKGFRCAYAVAHGGTGCSGYIKRRFRNDGLAAWPDARARLRACRAARIRLMTDASPERRQEKKEKGSWIDCVPSLDCSGCDFSL